MWIVRKLFGFVFAVAAILFALSNRDAVTITVWPMPYEATIPVYLLAFVFGLAGLCLGLVIAGSRGRKKSAEIGKLRKQIEEQARDLSRP